MGMFETESKEPFGVSSSLAENVRVEGSEQEKNENGVVVEVVKSSVLETEVVSVLKENDSQVVVDSEVNNGSVVCEKVDCEGKVVEGAVLSDDGEERKDENVKENEGGKDENVDGKIDTVKIPIVEISENVVDAEVNGVESEEGKNDEGLTEVPILQIGENIDVEVIGEESEEGKNDEVVNEVPVVETSESVDIDVDDLIDESSEFLVGDFVWGKIKSHPWWPGRVYDPSDASDYALKLKQKNRLLVVYFGDGTFAWCHPSQLKPFKDNFDDMARQSSKGFTNAVQEAVNEVGRVLAMKMSRPFVAAGQTESDFAPVLAENVGIKEGVFVPESGIERLSAVTIEPAELLSQLKQTAEIIDVASILGLEILKAQLSAFYFSRGGYKLPCYEDPKRVLGLEDKDDVENAVEAPFQGPFDEDYSNLTLSPKSGEPRHSPGLLGSRLNPQRKQKSIADIMGEDKDDASDEVLDTIRSRSKKKRKDSDDAAASKPVRKRKELVIDTDGKFVRAGKESREGEENSDKGKSLHSNEKKEASVNENISSEGSEKENDEEKPKEQNENGFSPRERKKSKYLSPPFTTSIGELVKGRIKPEARNADKLSPRVSKRNSEASQELELADSLNHQTQDDEKKTIDPEKVKVPSGEILSKIRDAAVSPQISREGTSSDRLVDFISVMRSSLYREGLLHKEYKKTRPGTGRKRKKPESGLDQSDTISPNEGGRRKKKTESELDQSNQVSPNEESEPAKKRKETDSSMSKGKKRARETETSRKKGTNEKSSPAVLVVSFWPGSSTLPSKADLITIYSKFGALNEEETNMFLTNYTARVSFLRSRDAEKALKNSQKKNPFEPSEVTFQLEYAETGTKSGGEHKERSKKSKPSQGKKKEKTPTPTAQGSETSNLNFIKDKLQGLLSTIESSDDNSLDLKTKVESEVKGLLEDVNNMVVSTSS
ncbi:unnamed protein product [Trifolium pratense]|uniref:Uncharacterized protein n=1 Tax=Trifolium pratense TaxID=57577 RepID=A0ACB0L7J8_TRIPR|nr:unnamed protein product [Trifolium pratense]